MYIYIYKFHSVNWINTDFALPGSRYWREMIMSQQEHISIFDSVSNYFADQSSLLDGFTEITDDWFPVKYAVQPYQFKPEVPVSESMYLSCPEADMLLVLSMKVSIFRSPMIVGSSKLCIDNPIFLGVFCIYKRHSTKPCQMIKPANFYIKAALNWNFN